MEERVFTGCIGTFASGFLRHLGTLLPRIVVATERQITLIRFARTWVIIDP